MKKIFFLIAIFGFLCISRVDAKVESTILGGSISWTNNNDPQSLGQYTTTFNNYGKGYVFFSVGIDNYTDSSVSAILTGGHILASNGSHYACNIGTVSTKSTNDVHNTTYSFVCPVEFINSSLRGVYIEKNNHTAHAYIRPSEYLTFISEEDYTTILNGIDSDLDNIKVVLNNIFATQSQAIQNVSANTTQLIGYLNQIIELIEQNQTQVSDKLDEQIQQNQQQIQEQEKTNEELGELNDNLTNSDAPDGMGSLGSASGWLPPGPVDSLLTLPLSMLNNISTSLGSTCKPINLPIPFVDKNLTMPCLNTIYSQISGLGVFLNSIGTIAAGFMLYYYFKKLYAYIDNLLSLKNNGEGWGDV